MIRPLSKELDGLDTIDHDYDFTVATFKMSFTLIRKDKRRTFIHKKPLQKT